MKWQFEITRSYFSLSLQVQFKISMKGDFCQAKNDPQVFRNDVRDLAAVKMWHVTGRLVGKTCLHRWQDAQESVKGKTGKDAATIIRCRKGKMTMWRDKIYRFALLGNGNCREIEACTASILNCAAWFPISTNFRMDE